MAVCLFLYGINREMYLVFMGLRVVTPVDVRIVGLRVGEIRLPMLFAEGRLANDAR